ncbi:3 beta-hydroxysteroid dehydrogenase type 7 [Rhizoclosmatium sp. JEL0117]|nr:3 beta-hydroxysteroid dehydrogenase type 7 [Rhizoclosmatium sp. JEL0117]
MSSVSAIILGTVLLIIAYIHYRIQSFLETNKLRFLNAPESLITTRNKSSPNKPNSPVYLVIGGSGNLGKLTVRQLLELGRTVRVFDLQNAWTHEPRVGFFQGDITNLGDVEKALEGSGVTHVIHHASLVVIGAYDHEVLKRVNIDGTRNVMEAVYKTSSVVSVVYTSSVCQYGYNSDPQMETLPPLSKVEHFHPYFRSKAIAEDYVLACNSPAVRTAAIRAAAVLGQNFDMIRHMMDPNTPLLMVKGSKEGFVHSEDLARAHILLVDALADPDRSEKSSGKPYMISGCSDADSVSRKTLYTDIYRTLHPGKNPKIIDNYFLIRLISTIADIGQIAQVFGKSPLDLGQIMKFHRGNLYYTFMDVIVRKEEKAAWKNFGYEPAFTVATAVATMAPRPKSISED